MARVPTIDPAEFPSELAAVLGNPGSDQRVALGALPAWAVRPDVQRLGDQRSTARSHGSSDRIRSTGSRHAAAAGRADFGDGHRPVGAAHHHNRPGPHFLSHVRCIVSS